MICAIAYGNDRFSRSRDYNLKTAIKKGKADTVIAYSPNDIDESFFKKYEDILSQNRGNGYWLWKPYIILKTLNELEDGDYLMYADAGSVYRKPIQTLIDCMEQNGQNVLCFSLQLIEKNWSKRDAFVILDCDLPVYADTPQRLASFILCKNCAETRSLISEWLNLCTDRRIITDDENMLGLPNYEGFQDNRHDQTCWSLLTKKRGIPAFRDPSQFGEGSDISKKNHALSSYPTVFLHHRKANLNNGFKLFLYNLKIRLYGNKGLPLPVAKIISKIKKKLLK